jgi:hypothetical protein
MPHNLEEEHAPVIEDFVASICPELEEAVILSPGVFNAVSRTIKINQVMETRIFPATSLPPMRSEPHL